MKLTCVKADTKTDAYLVGVRTDKKGVRSAPGLKALSLDNAEATRLVTDKTLKVGLASVIAIPGKPTIALVGLGNPDDLTSDKLANAISKGLGRLKALGIRRVATTIAADATGALDEDTAITAAAQGAILGGLTFDQWKSPPKKKAKKPAIDTLQFVAAPAAQKVLTRAVIAAEATNDARLLANTPANIATPKWMAAEARRRGRDHGFKVTVKGRAQLRREGFGAMCGVAQGSPNEEQLVVMEYKPAKTTSRTKTLAVVGKGVCFDSGGISIKPSQNMWDMKYDKCGACNTIALMVAVARLKLPHRVIAFAPCVENMPGGNAQRPGDIVTAKNGTTIEVLNTDAEGRLILADAVHVASTLKPKWILEMSTLTGACEIAIGTTYVAVMSKDDQLAEAVLGAAGRAGDKAWRLPQGEEFDEANKGTFGDMQNISLTSRAGTSIGGSFIGHFAGKTPFVHLDIASKAWTPGVGPFAKGPTGAGLRIALQTLVEA